jgi:hypothetical protein
VLLLLTIALVVVGAVSLLIGFVNDQMFPIYLSIGCSVLAAVVLLVFSRLSRTRLEPAARPATSGAATTAVRTQTAAAPSSFSAADDDVFPIADYDDLRVSEILPLLPELDLDELETVREREESGRARASILRRLDELADELEAPAPAAVAAGSARDDDDLFPIEDYDDLRAGEILPLLDELEPDELEDVAARERSGAARASILDRIDVRLGREPEPVTIAASRAGSGTKKAVKKTAAKKTAAKKAPAKKAAPTKAPAKKAAAKKATSSAKAAGGAAKKATGGAKKAAKKATGSTKKG